MPGLSEENKAKIAKVMKFFIEVSMADTSYTAAQKALEICPDKDEAIERLKGMIGLYMEKGSLVVATKLEIAISIIKEG